MSEWLKGITNQVEITFVKQELLLSNACVLCVPQFATVEVAITFIKDEFGPQILRFLKREELLTLVMCIVGFILGIPHVTKVQYLQQNSLLVSTSEYIWTTTCGNSRTTSDSLVMLVFLSLSPLLHREAYLCSS